MITIGVMSNLPRAIKKRYGEGMYSLFMNKRRQRFIILKNTLISRNSYTGEADFIKNGYIVILFEAKTGREFSFFGESAIKIITLHCKNLHCKNLPDGIFHNLYAIQERMNSNGTMDLAATILLELLLETKVDNPQEIATAIYNAAKSIECDNESRFTVYSYPLEHDLKYILKLAEKNDVACGTRKSIKRKRLLKILKRGCDIAISRPVFNRSCYDNDSEMPPIVSCILGVQVNTSSGMTLYCPFFFIESEFECSDAPLKVLNEIRILNKRIPITLDIQEDSVRELLFISEYCNGNGVKVVTELVKVPGIHVDTYRFYMESLVDSRRNHAKEHSFS